MEGEIDERGQGLGDGLWCILVATGGNEEGTPGHRAGFMDLTLPNPRNSISHNQQFRMGKEGEEEEDLV